MEKGTYLPLDQLEANNAQALETVKHIIDSCEKEWEKFYQRSGKTRPVPGGGMKATRLLRLYSICAIL
jgi:hypothetical protein